MTISKKTIDRIISVVLSAIKKVNSLVSSEGWVALDSRIGDFSEEVTFDMRCHSEKEPVREKGGGTCPRQREEKMQMP